MRLIWFKYCSPELFTVPWATFVSAVEYYLVEQVNLPRYAVDAVLTLEDRAALKLVMDLNGEV